jgi:hypothetical protein
MHGAEEIVPAPHVAQLVAENSVELSRIQALQKLGWQNQDRPQKTDDARFLSAWRDDRPYGDREFDGPAGSHYSPDSQPTAASCERDRKKPDSPYDAERDGHPIQWGVRGNEKK